MDVTPQDFLEALSGGAYIVALAIAVFLVLGALRSEKSPAKIRAFLSGWKAWLVSMILGMASAVIVAGQAGVAGFKALDWITLLVGGAVAGLTASGTQAGLKNMSSPPTATEPAKPPEP